MLTETNIKKMASLSTENISCIKNLNSWSKDSVEGAVDRVLTGKPFINIDFERVYSQGK